MSKTKSSNNKNKMEQQNDIGVDVFKNDSELKNEKILQNKINEYDISKTLNQNIGTSYEYFVLNEIRSDYDEVWYWSNFFEKILYDLKIIKNTFYTSIMFLK